MNKINKHSSTLFLSKKQAESLGIVDLENQEIVVNNRFVSATSINSFADEIKLDKMVTKAFTFYNEQAADKKTLLDIFDDYDYESQNISYLTYYESRVYDLIRKYFLGHKLKTTQILDCFLANEPYKNKNLDDLKVLEEKVLKCLDELSLNIKNMKYDVLELEDHHITKHIHDEEDFTEQKAELEASLDIQLILLYLLSIIQAKTNPEFEQEWARVGLGVDRIPAEFTEYDYRVRKDFLNDRNFQQMVSKLKDIPSSTTPVAPQGNAKLESDKKHSDFQPEIYNNLPIDETAAPTTCSTSTLKSDVDVNDISSAVIQSASGLKVNFNQPILETVEEESIEATKDPLIDENRELEQPVYLNKEEQAKLESEYNDFLEKYETQQTVSEKEALADSVGYEEILIEEDYLHAMHQKDLNANALHHETEPMWKNEANVDMIFEKDTHHNSEPEMVNDEELDDEEEEIESSTNKESLSIKDSPKKTTAVNEDINYYVVKEIKHYESMIKDLEHKQNDGEVQEVVAESSPEMLLVKNVVTDEEIKIDVDPVPTGSQEELQKEKLDLIKKYSDEENANVNNKFKILDQRQIILDNMKKYQETNDVHYLKDEQPLKAGDVCLKDFNELPKNDKPEKPESSNVDNDYDDLLALEYAEMLEAFENDQLDVKQVEVSNEFLVKSHEQKEPTEKKRVPWFKRKKNK
ncbi:hypothetical protein OF375_00845 [Ureaplasma miroungigenitalium]|uniref:hypothetical protein n=1 Tax=Ureaplasma miroungigenitalium TaxID=1042321 RepID=UPI0021E75693|nr:hypothetical protein [Ureaplasma miroungigenitalium]MCV3734135.1 hypothetical protein [Ureaplasma miroungigenitalium]